MPGGLANLLVLQSLNQMSKIEYDYLTEKEVLDEAKTYCALRGTLHIYNAIILSRTREKTKSMPHAVLKTLSLEEVRTTTKIIKPGHKDSVSSKITWRRIKVE